ncbi:hypothetical protein CPIN18021_0263 [Campylobacter pinnipediorum subsp. caledonicus]|uniref:Uncharacterized protein n=1 Tax=Campylobacter pinnipediorum subsp. caledonicus TaxID=1874362 RepID=A0A1S6U608_9BACT|nr:hypothetical protein [Campylobacter pinnipediorum]AQW87110.1 hypothetical protein CPIN18021_0263 [Campylobacter pinnipediorum subsp. caledonicus]
MNVAFNYLVMGFRNAFTPVKIKHAKEYGETFIDFYKKRDRAIEEEQLKRKSSKK